MSYEIIETYSDGSTLEIYTGLEIGNIYKLVTGDMSTQVRFIGYDKVCGIRDTMRFYDISTGIIYCIYPNALSESCVHLFTDMGEKKEIEWFRVRKYPFDLEFFQVGKAYLVKDDDTYRPCLLAEITPGVLDFVYIKDGREEHLYHAVEQYEMSDKDITYKALTEKVMR